MLGVIQARSIPGLGLKALIILLHCQKQEIAALPPAAGRLLEDTYICKSVLLSSQPALLGVAPGDFCPPSGYCEADC